MSEKRDGRAPVAVTAGWASVLGAALALGIVEAIWSLSTIDPLQLSALSPLTHAAALLVAAFAAVAVHGLPAWFLARLALARRPWRWPWIAAAAAFGVSLELTMVGGDGVRSHSLFWLIHLGLLAVVPAAAALFAAFVLLPGRLPARWRRGAVGATLAGCLAFGLLALPTYRAFHGHLVLIEALLLAWLLHPLAARRAFRLSVVAAAVAVLALGAAFAPRRVEIQGHVERLSRLAGPLASTSPLTRPLLLPLELLADPDRPVPADLAAELEARFAPRSAPAASAPRGTNVVLIVLEAVRADTWADPAVAPRFHEWRARGVYFPRAVSPYPATPLAYGAMFTGHPPSVVAQSPHWAKRPLFGCIARRFERLVLSRPDNKWFAHGAVTGFFAGEGVPVAIHASAEEALEHLRKGIEEAGDAPFFAWTHLYESHTPYEIHEGFDFGADERGRYRSEVAWLDDRLGRFADWLWARPASDRTLLVVLGDHGEGLGDIIDGAPFHEHHVHVHGVATSVPMFLAGPELPAGAVEERLRVGLIDVMPTIFDFLGEPLPSELLVQGESIYRLLRERPDRDLAIEAFSIRGSRFFDQVARAGSAAPVALREQYRETAAFGGYSSKIALERWPRKIVYDRTLHRCRLFDLERDPGEARDLADGDPAALREMRQRLGRWVDTQGWVLRRLEGTD